MKKRILIGLAVVAVCLIAFVFVALRTSAKVRVERTVNAPLAKVWVLWNDPQSIQKWWSPKGYTAPTIKNDLKTGGTYLLSMKGPDGKVIWNVGKYTEIIPMKKITSRMAFADENGNPVPASTYGVPGHWPDDVLVTVEFKESDGKTTILVQEEGIPLIMKLFAGMGWNQQFDKFETLL